VNPLRRLASREKEDEVMAQLAEKVEESSLRIDRNAARVKR
jgi:hypothetical protein